MDKVQELLQAEEKRNAEFREIERKLLLQIANRPPSQAPTTNLTIEYRISKAASAGLAHWDDAPTSRGNGSEEYLARMLETRKVMKCLEAHKITGHVVFEI